MATVIRPNDSDALPIGVVQPTINLMPGKSVIVRAWEFPILETIAAGLSNVV